MSSLYYTIAFLYSVIFCCYVSSENWLQHLYMSCLNLLAFLSGVSLDSYFMSSILMWESDFLCSCCHAIHSSSTTGWFCMMNQCGKRLSSRSDIEQLDCRYQNTGSGESLPLLQLLCGDLYMMMNFHNNRENTGKLR